MKKHFKTRLLRVADLIETVPISRFDMVLWGLKGTGPECGTVGCAIGWATQDPWFQKRGLRSRKTTPSLLPMIYNPKTGRVLTSIDAGFDAVEHFFGLSEEDARYLFCALQYEAERPRPKTVSKRIRDFVEAN